MSEPLSPAIIQAGDSLDADAIYRRISWRVIPFLMVCYLCAYLDRINVGFAKLQMMDDLNLGAAAYGLGAGIFFIGYCLCEVPSNIMLHKVGARLWIARIMITWGIVSGLFSLVHTEWQFYLLRFLLGLAEAGLAPGVLLYLTYWFPSSRRAKVTVLWFTAIPMSGIVGGPLSGWLLERLDGAMGWHGWRWMFLVEAIPTVIVGLFAIALLRNGVRDAKWLSEDEKALVLADLARDDAHKTSHASTLSFLKDRRIWLLASVYFCIVLGQYGITFWLPSLIKGAGVQSPLQIGLLSALPYLVAIVSMILLGRSSDRHRERRWHLVVPMVLGAAGLALSTVGSDAVVIAIASLCLAAAGILAASSLFWMLPTNILGGISAAAGIAAINSIANFGGFFSPNLVGLAAQLTGSTSASMYVMALLLVLAASLVLRMKPETVNH